jgi:hypothetical protein
VPDLTFEIEGVAPQPHAASPLLNFKLRVANSTPEPIHTVILRCQIMLEVARPHYSGEEQEQLLDLFGPPSQWDRTLRSMLWTNTSAVIPAFSGSTIVNLPVPCTFDFNVAATKYFAGLEDGEAPLLLLFSGTVFYAAASGALQVTQISWEKEAHYRLPVSVWQAMMDCYYPNSAWLCLRRDVFERLHRFKVRRGIPTFDQALEMVVPDAMIEVDGISEENTEDTIH